MIVTLYEFPFCVGNLYEGMSVAGMTLICFAGSPFFCIWYLMYVAFGAVRIVKYMMSGSYEIPPHVKVGSVIKVSHQQSNNMCL